ncbi:MAG TPA: amino acid racemase [Terriglobales bacterium]|jgi:aspartate racemase|nr:amino acid racemase [Terriglobales bacterium]
MPQHIGIVACSAEGAALCYRTICIEGAAVMGAHDHPEVSMHTHSLGEYKKHYPQGDWEGVARLMLSSAEKLAHAGADFLICPDNTIHAAFEHVLGKSPLPWLHIAEEVAKEAQRQGFKRLGVLGTYSLTSTQVYPEKLGQLGIACEFLDEAGRREIDRVIMDELVYGQFPPDSLLFFQDSIDDFRQRGCDAVVLGCTEIPLLVQPGDSALPTLDSTRLLARAALKRACGR